MLFAAATAAAIGTFFATYGATIATTVGVGLMAAGAGVSIYSGYQANEAAKTAANQQRAASQAAAAAQQMAAEAQSQQLKDKAELAALQANVENQKAGVAQEQGEIEARKRMLQLSYDIGNVYAGAAGNGLLVDGGNDTVGQILTANVREAAQDVGIVKANAANQVWEHEMNATSALMTQKSYLAQSEASSLVGQADAGATLLSGEAQAYATRQAGLTALYQGWGNGLSMLGSAAMGGANAGLFGGGGNTGGGFTWAGGKANWANSGGWAGTNTVQTIASATPTTMIG